MFRKVVQFSRTSVRISYAHQLRDPSNMSANERLASDPCPPLFAHQIPPPACHYLRPRYCVGTLIAGHFHLNFLGGRYEIAHLKELGSSRPSWEERGW